MAEGGATYTVNIELDSKQFSQDLRTLKNKIKDDLGKAVKVGTNQGTTRQQVAQQIRQQREEDQAARKRFYNADKINAFRVRQGKATADNNKLLKLGLDVEERQKDIGAAMKAAEKGRFQWAEAKLKVANEQIAKDFKDLDLINKKVEAEKKLVDETNKKAAAEKKVQDRAKKVADAKKKEADARKAERVANKAEARENRQRKGPQGIRMHGPVDLYGNPIYQGKGPAVPKSGASLPIDLQRKGTGKFATSHTKLLRRRQNLETLLSTFEGISNPEINTFKKGIQGLVKQYGDISTSMGQTKNAPSFGNAGEIGRQLQELDNLTHREEQRAKRIQTTNKHELDLLNDKHRVEKLLARLDKKGVDTTSKRLKLEKAITAQDKQQLKDILRQVELENIGLKGVSGTGGGRGGKGSTIVGGPSSPLNVERGWVKPGPKSTGRWGRMGQSALISGGFPLLFGQNPAVAAVGAAGGAIGEAITPGGGFAGGIAATALTTAISQAVASVGELGKALNKSTFDVSKLSAALGASGTATEKYLKLLKENEGKQVAYEESIRRMTQVVGADGVAALQQFSSDMEKGSRGLATLGSQIKSWFADLWINRLKDKGFLNLGGISKLSEPFNRAALRNQAYDNEDPLMKSLIEKRDATKLGTDARIDLEDRIIELQKFFNLTNKAKDKAKAQAEYETKAIRSIKEKNLLMEETLQYGAKDAAIKAQIRNMEAQFKKDGEEFNDTMRKRVELGLKHQQNLQRQVALYQSLGDTVKNGLIQVLNDALDKTKSINDAMNKLLTNISNKLLDYGISALLANSGLPGAKKFFGHFADGGRPPKGRPSIVGERGPELFVPDSSGTIIPNHELGSGSNVVVNVDATGTAVEGDSGQAEQLGSMLAEAVQAELVKQQRPGGILARSR